nr:reverse transcriptase domain-containing protein [Tanacetum cinerariifolium]
MSTHSSARNLFLPLDNPELTIQRRPRVDPTLLNDFEMATDGNGDDVPPPGGGDDANKHLDKFLHVTQSIKVNGVTDDVLHLYPFPHSLTHHATAWFDRFPRNSINTFEQMTKMFLEKYFPPSMVTKLRNEITNSRQRGTFMKRRPEECYDLIEKMIAHHNDWDTSVHRTYQALAYQALGYQAPVQQAPIPQPQVVTTIEFTNYMKANNATSLTNSNLELKNMFGQFMKMNTASSSGSGTLPCNTITNPKEDLNVERETEVTKEMVPPTNNRSTKDVQPLVVQVENQVPNSELVVALVVEPVKAPVSAPKPNLKSSIPYPSRLHDQKLCDKANDLKSLTLMPIPDFDADPRLPLILERSFLKTGHALIDVYEGELTLRVGDKAITFKLDQTARYSANYDAMSVNRIDLIDVACEEYS